MSTESTSVDISIDESKRCNTTSSKVWGALYLILLGVLSYVSYLAISNRIEYDDNNEKNFGPLPSNETPACPDLFDEIFGKNFLCTRTLRSCFALREIIEQLDPYQCVGKSITESTLCFPFSQGLTSDAFHGDKWFLDSVPSCPAKPESLYSSDRGYNCANDVAQVNCSWILSYNYSYNSSAKQGSVTWGIKDNGPYTLPNGTIFYDAMYNVTIAHQFNNNSFPPASQPPVPSWCHTINVLMSPGYPEIRPIFADLSSALWGFYNSYAAKVNNAYCDILHFEARERNEEKLKAYTIGKEQFEKYKKIKSDSLDENYHVYLKCLGGVLAFAASSGIIHFLLQRHSETISAAISDLGFLRGRNSKSYDYGAAGDAAVVYLPAQKPFGAT